MIKSQADYVYFLEEDRKSLNKKRKKPVPFIGDEIWKFQRLMRKIEYINNCKGVLYKPYLYFLMVKYRKLSIKLGFTIPINCFGYGLSIAHYGTIIINSNVRIGNYCRIHASTNIGGTGTEVPQLGNNVYIGPGVKLFGKIKIADGIQIGANAVVNRTFEKENITIVGVPAREVSK